MDMLKTAQHVFDMEIQALTQVRDCLGEPFLTTLDLLLSCRGKVVVCGMGTSGHIARKIAATLSSLGTPSIFLHPAEALHGDIGTIQPQDLLIIISFSGESQEVIDLLPSIHIIGAPLVAITSNSQSRLAKSSRVAQIIPKVQEACVLGLAPTSSTTAVLAFGDALAVAAAESRQFSKRQFGVFHPSGALGRQLTLRVDDLMTPVSAQDCLAEGSSLSDAVLLMTRLKLDILPVLRQGALVGVLSDESLMERVRAGGELSAQTVDACCHRDCAFLNFDDMAQHALRILTRRACASMPVFNGDRLVGIVSRNMIEKSGIYI